MASSRLIVDSPPLVDPHSLLNKVTFSFLLKIGPGGTGSFEEEEFRNKHEITVNFKFKLIHIESNEKENVCCEIRVSINLTISL